MLPRFLLISLLAVSCGMAQQQDDKPLAIPDLETVAQASYMHGDYEAARQSLLKAWDLAQMLPPADPIRYDVLKRIAGARAAAGEFADADDFLQLAISWREQNLGENDPKTVDDVLLSVAYARGRKDYEQALRIMSRVVRMHITANVAGGAAPGEAMNSITVADDFSRIAQIQAEMTKPEAAVGSLSTAIGIRTKLLGPLEPSLVYDLDRMGNLQITLRGYPKAEEAFRHALVIRETLYGKMNADLISNVDGLAYALFGQKRYDEAEQQYIRLLGLWKSSVGDEKHPMIAMALDKVAVFYAAQKKWDQVRETTGKANAIRAYLLAEGLSVEGSQRIEEGKLAEALPFYQRGLRVLEVPNEIYEEEHVLIENMAKELEKVVKKPPSAAPAPQVKSKK